MSINEVFATETNNSAASTSSRSLAGTAQLTSTASTITAEVINAVDARMKTEEGAYLGKMLEDSRKDSAAMDKLIEEIHPLTVEEASYLSELDETTLESMLKSQQSKRSRAKGKAMTLDNYRTMMTAAVAENLIRLVAGKQKSAGGYKSSGPVDMSDEALNALAEDQEKLKKEIRNTQSKKSILKSKEGFTEEDPRWVELCAYEEALKARRTNTASTIIVDTTKDAIKELIKDKDITSLKAADMKAIMASITEILGE